MQRAAEGVLCNNVECDACLAAIYEQLAVLQAGLSSDGVYDRADKKPTLADVAECAGAGGANRKRTENKEFRTPDNDVDPLADLLEHTVNCLYAIPSCRDSGYDILADEGVVDEDGARLYYAKYRYVLITTHTDHCMC